MTRAFAPCVFALSLVATALGQPKGPPKLPDETVVVAWEAAGAEHGSAEWSESQTRRLASRTRPATRAGEIPAFHIHPATKLAGLKDPGVPFGLVLRKEVGDEQIKALPTLESLQYVLAYGQPLTDAAAKDLARQKGLRYLDLGRSKVTGAGMKELATLPALETLHVDSIKAGNAGLAELVKVKTLREGIGKTWDGEFMAMLAADLAKSPGALPVTEMLHTSPALLVLAGGRPLSVLTRTDILAFFDHPGTSNGPRYSRACGRISETSLASTM